ncbi:Na+/H+ antiporter NhaA [Candidatus Laterigemmans baculatus]|uniref:Na+/H+ antiporter NhaA n=1 Tax=Candidatus Laterigemmans baculatus TaxID=2770505 RepID=UPI0013DB69C8|nr:Na+/H+ antiporter NhaA [Candidatus Laterigemmans baculatus]
MAEHHDSDEPSLLPNERIHVWIKPLARFMHIEASSGFVLLATSVAALLLANSPWAESFLGFWKLPIGISLGEFELNHSLKHWINDGLMVIFFFVIGLEVKRELVLGELREIRRATLPVAAALGGMLVPAGLYLALQAGQEGQDGWGIPMATDIAFVVGCMALLGRRIPANLRVMLLSLAIVDDIGAILVIAVGYTSGIEFNWLLFGGVGIAVVWLMQRVGVRSMGIYVFMGTWIWLGFHESGVHATIAGVILGLMTPAHAYLNRGLIADVLSRARHGLQGERWESESRLAERVVRFRRVTREVVSPLEYLIRLLHPWVAFLIMPLFALANAGVAFELADIVSPVALAVIVGLAVGKPLGIVLICWLAIKLRIAPHPAGVRWRHIIGGGFLAGIGFTMALFITELALEESLLRSAKVGVLFGSLASAIVGMAILAGSGTVAEEQRTDEGSSESGGPDEIVERLHIDLAT